VSIVSRVIDAPAYVLQATTTRVELWTCARIPFEAGVTRPWKMELVRELKAATTALAGDGPLAGTYATTLQVICDAENSLFTNPGTAAFPANTGAIRWEHDPNDPPPRQSPWRTWVAAFTTTATSAAWTFRSGNRTCAWPDGAGSRDGWQTMVPRDRCGWR